MEYYAEIKRDKLQMHIRTWINLKFIMLNNKTDTGVHATRFHLCDILEKGTLFYSE